MYMPIRGPLDAGKPASAEEVAKLRTLLKQLASEETALESAIRESVPAYAMASQVRLPEGEERARAITRDPAVAVIEYTLCDEGLVVVGLRGGKSPKVALIPVTGDELWHRIGKLRELIWKRKPEADSDASALYKLLVAPVEGLLTGATRLRIVADGALQLIPFAALRDSEGKYLAERVAVATSPSLSLLFASRPKARERATLPALVVAAPDTGAISDEVSSDETRGSPAANGSRGSYLPIRGMYMPVRGQYMPIRGEDGVSDALTMMAAIPLPGAKAEGEAIAKQLPGATLLAGKAATKARLLRDGGNCDILHIATHGYADPDAPDFSGLLLAGEAAPPAGGKPDPNAPLYTTLTAQEVYLWSLKARLVTLSACQTGLGKDVAGEGLLGLTRAFLYAGARDVVCSLWPVSDESTMKLMTGLYGALPRSAAVEQALQEAQKTLIADPATRHPFFWAGFAAVRGPQ
jgi:CHAT domain-containing protein